MADHAFFSVKYNSTVRTIRTRNPMRLRMTGGGSAAHIGNAAMSLEC